MQPSPEDVARSVSSAATWDERVGLIRRVPERFGAAAHREVYAAIAAEVYVPSLAPDFAYVHWKDEYELAPFEEAYGEAHQATAGFLDVQVDALRGVVEANPKTLRVFRLILGFTTQEFAASTKAVHEVEATPIVSNTRIKALEGGAKPREREAQACAEVIDRVMNRRMFDAESPGVRPKTQKPDTADGWQSVQSSAEQGVPYARFLHQRHYGGAFRQLLDATSSRRGAILEDALEALLSEHRVPFVRTGTANQGLIAERFGLTVHPAPDFVVADSAGTLRALIECKAANDGGTARDKAGRFMTLRTEAVRLGGVPVVAVLAGLGWTRTRDALGPVVEATDGRVFTLANLAELIEVQPFSQLLGGRLA